MGDADSGVAGGWDREGLSEKERFEKLVEANVKKGVKTLKENGEVIKAMKERGLLVHGFVYDIACGELRELEIREEKHEGENRVAAFETK